jgi:hypothetical protein
LDVECCLFWEGEIMGDGKIPDVVLVELGNVMNFFITNSGEDTEELMSLFKLSPEVSSCSDLADPE